MMLIKRIVSDKIDDRYLLLLPEIEPANNAYFIVAMRYMSAYIYQC